MIVETTRKVYFVPSKGRHYLSKYAAINAAAKALIEAKHPSTQPDYNNGRMADSGWNRGSMPRSDVLFRRVRRLVRAATHQGGAA